MSSFVVTSPVVSTHPSYVRMCSMPSTMMTVPYAVDRGVWSVKMMGWQTAGGSASIVYARERVVLIVLFLPVVLMGRAQGKPVKAPRRAPNARTAGYVRSQSDWPLVAPVRASSRISERASAPTL